MLRLRRTTACSVLLSLAASAGFAGPAEANSGICKGPTKWITLCARKPGEEPGGDDRANRTPQPPTKPGDKGGNEKDRYRCTRTLADPQPPAGSPEWEGHNPGDGAIYLEHCAWEGDVNGGNVRIRYVWANSDEVVTVDPAVLAQQAVDSMLLAGPKVASPRAAGTYTVGVPMWLWVTPSATTWGPNTASASAGGITVTATAKVSSISWRMGDGATVTCSGPGTAYAPARGLSPSPDCGHLYRVPSSRQAGGKYQGTATTTWTVDWAVNGGGQSGQLTEVRSTGFAVAVGELQVVGQ